MTDSSDDAIGNTVEQEYEENDVHEDIRKQKKPRAKPLSQGEKARIIAGTMNQQEDPIYKATNKNGKWYVRKRKVPLPTVNTTVKELPPKQETVGSPISGDPVIEKTIEEKKETKVEPQEKNNYKELKQQFFTTQTSINEDLRKALEDVSNRCCEIETKYEKLKKEKAKRKIEKLKNIKREQVKFEKPKEENEYEYEYEEDETEKPYQPTEEEFRQYVLSLPPYKRGPYLNIFEF